MGARRGTSRLALSAAGLVVAVALLGILSVGLKMHRWGPDCRSLRTLVERHQQRISERFEALDENDAVLDEALASAFDEAARDADEADVGQLATIAGAYRDRMRRGAAASRAIAAAARASNREETRRLKSELAVDGVSMQGSVLNDIDGRCIE